MVGMGEEKLQKEELKKEWQLYEDTRIFRVRASPTRMRRRSKCWKANDRFITGN